MNKPFPPQAAGDALGGEKDGAEGGGGKRKRVQVAQFTPPGCMSTSQPPVSQTPEQVKSDAVNPARLENPKT